ncbi:hypothetical protein ASPCADRAFT_208627 [Aspergillus carbonarius ITEM 5010]|uniref:Uncharacterized protein n=1 Tax=Aspergillus carbonarius (strain ITEM 5010) TaxID=602072 RepID=A0A1R3RKK2_ASPC5|nr:hypothetical protein ASPCADRAFT_208627 [Aspergillus carbonarius ITEM 5010]
MNLKALPSGQTTLRRADFLAALVALVPPEIVRFGKRLSRLAETSEGVREATVSTMYIGKGAYAISYPIMRAKKVNFTLYILSETWDDEA